jgi:hypothetical protein
MPSLDMCTVSCCSTHAGALDAFFNSLMGNSVPGSSLAVQLQHMREVTARNALLQVPCVVLPLQVGMFHDHVLHRTLLVHGLRL